MMAKYFWKFVIFLLVLFTNLAVSDGNKTKDPQYDFTLSANCTIEFKRSDVKLYRKVTTGRRNKLVNVHFRFTHAVTLRQEKYGDLFEPLTWVHITGQQGKAMLNLFYHYEALSLQTMSIGVEHVTIGVTESLVGCLTDQPMSVFGPFFRDRLLNNFKQYMKTDIPLPTGTMEESYEGLLKEQVCYLTIAKDKDVAKFTYICCKNIKNGTVCSEITTDEWMKLVKIFTSVINVLVFVFCPFLVPENYYNETTRDVHYHKKIPTKQRKRIKMLKTNVNDNVASRSNVISDSLVDKHMPKLSKTVHDMKLHEPYEFDLGTIEFRVNCKDLVSDNDVPVGLFSAIYNGFLKCEGRHLDSMMNCCNEDISGTLIPFSCSVKWYVCLSHLRQTVIVFLLIIPWIARVIFYNRYEKDLFEKLKIAAESRDLRVPYLGNVTLYLSPSHVTFLICYFTILIVSVCFNSLQTIVLRDIQSTLRDHFKMQKTFCNDFVGHALKLFLEPCYKFGIFGLILCPLFWAIIIPLVLTFLLLNFVPIFNLTLRLLGSVMKHLIPSKRERRQDNFWFLFFKSLGRLMMTFVYLLEFYSFLFLLIEFVQFVVLVAIYTLIGITLNSSYAMRYLPLLFMVALYGHTTFGGVYRKYLVFNKILHKHLLKMWNDKPFNGKSELLSADSNTAFQIPTKTTNNITDTFSVENFTVLLRTSHQMLFVDQKGTPHIKKTFFFQCCEIDHYAAPGTLLSNFSKAICRFLLIITFLLFVGLVVMAFSEEFKVSVTNQTFITVAGGLIPFVLTNFLFREVGLPMVEANDVRFRRCLDKAISQGVERFPVVNFECEPLIKKDTQIRTAAMTAGSCLQQYDLIINVQKSPRQGPNQSQDRAGSGDDSLNRVESGMIGSGSGDDLLNRVESGRIGAASGDDLLAKSESGRIWAV